ncbi:MAG: hypothetical protein IKF41_01680 [Alphaproteobacteria bacterium]|nr:hypothetical protein [Alphaproteobacteria bacterium]
MKDTKVRNFLLGSILVGGLAAGVRGCSPKQDNNDDASKAKTELPAPEPKNDKFGNIALFESLRSDIKFALAFVENYYPYVYWCGEAWTTAYGLTVLYAPNGTCKKVTENTNVPTIKQSDIYKGRYLTNEILPDIKNRVTVPMNENTLIAACALRYCIGHKNFIKSDFLKYLNAGKSCDALAKTLTGWRQQKGVINRMYFFAALMTGKIDYSDLLDLRAEGCYNLTYKDMVVYQNGKPKKDKDDFYEWDFSKVRENLKKAKQPRTVCLNLGKKKGNVKVACKPVKDIVPEYIWQEVNAKSVPAKPETAKVPEKNSNASGLLVFGALGAGAYLYARKKYLMQR